MAVFTPAQQRAITKALKILEESANYNEQVFSDPQSVKNFLTLKLSGLEHEEFHVLYLDNRNRLIECWMESKGTIDGAAVYPREIVKSALQANAAAVILGHNHPSGEAEPSSADKAITKRLVDALALIDIRVLDHIIVTKLKTYSFAENGLI